MSMSTQDNKTFENDLKLWHDISNDFGDILVESNTDDDFEWHATITRDGYKFHFMVFWHEKCPIEQPKICLEFDQRCMISSSYFKGSWMVLSDVQYFTVTNVLLGMKHVVSTINLENVKKDMFNNSSCFYCNFGDKNTTLENKNDEINMENGNNMTNNKTNSVSNSSVASLTLSHVSHHSINTNSEKEIPVLSNILPEKPMPKISSPMVPKVNRVSNPKQLVTRKIVNNVNINHSNNVNSKSSSKPRTNSWSNAVSKDNDKVTKKAIKYLDIDNNGRLVWKWTIGRRS